MKIRSITYFTEIGFPFDDSRVVQAGKFLGEAKKAFQEEGFEVQTTRLALQPFAKTFGNAPIKEAVKYAQDLEAACFVRGIDYASLGVARPDDPASYYEIIPEIIRSTGNVFAAGVIASPLNGVSLEAIRRTAKIIQRCSTISEDGLGNLRFAALANVEPSVPFLPSAYHEGGSPVFSVATESADLAVDAFAGASSLAAARERLVNSISDAAKRINNAARKIGGARGVRFAGIDFSLATFPKNEASIGNAIESLGVKVGAHGTLAAAAFITDSIHRAKFQAVGFSGLFMPLLEDNVLASRGAEGVLTVNDLLLYSAVCGTGLDTIPLAGDISVEEIAPILLDVAALALRLGKPLTARLMPMPNKKAGDEIKFNFPFFANGRVLSHKSRPLQNVLGGNESFELARR